MPIWLENAYSRPFWGNFGGKNRGNGKLFFAVLSLYECNKLELTSNESNSVKRGSTVWPREVSIIWGNKNRKN